MGKYYKIALNISCTISLIVLMTASHSLANSEDRPIVISKKIEVPEHISSQSDIDCEADTKLRRPAFAPRSDLAEIKETDEMDQEPDEILTAKYSSQDQQKSRYHPKGKIDPFEPLFKKVSNKKEDIVLTPKPAPEGHVPGDLEKIDPSQLRLTGIIVASDRNLGLVQEASGKGHIIARGTPIGTRGGRVSAILKDKVILKETMISNDGRTVVRQKELKLRNKSIGFMEKP